jgi:hypothetical protein
MKLSDSLGRCFALIYGGGSDYVREKVRVLKDALISVFGEHEFEAVDSSKWAQSYISARLDIFNRFAEKVCLDLLIHKIPSNFVLRVMVLLQVSTPTFYRKALGAGLIIHRGHLTYAKQHEII